MSALTVCAVPEIKLVPLANRSKSATPAIPPLLLSTTLTSVKLAGSSVFSTEQITASPKATVMPSLTLVSAAPVQLKAPLV